MQIVERCVLQRLRGLRFRRLLLLLLVQLVLVLVLQMMRLAGHQHMRRRQFAVHGGALAHVRLDALAQVRVAGRAADRAGGAQQHVGNVGSGRMLVELVRRRRRRRLLIGNGVRGVRGAGRRRLHVLLGWTGLLLLMVVVVMVLLLLAGCG